MQILLTDFHSFAWIIVWENLIKDQRFSPLVTILLILITSFIGDGHSRDFEWKFLFARKLTFRHDKLAQTNDNLQ